MHFDDTDLGERLGLLADNAVRGPAPVEEMVRGGRRRRARRRMVVGTAAVLAVGVTPLAAASLPSTNSEPATVPTASESATQTADETVDGLDPTVVELYEQVQVSDDRVIALLPGGERYAAAPPDAIDAEIERAGGVPDVALPEDGCFEESSPEGPYPGFPPLIGVVSTEGVEGMVFETEEGETRDVKLFTLPGDPGWAVYYVDFETEDFPFTVSTWDSDGDNISHVTYIRAEDAG